MREKQGTKATFRYQAARANILALREQMTHGFIPEGEKKDREAELADLELEMEVARTQIERNREHFENRDQIFTVKRINDRNRERQDALDTGVSRPGVLQKL